MILILYHVDCTEPKQDGLNATMDTILKTTTLRSYAEGDGSSFTPVLFSTPLEKNMDNLIKRLPFTPVLNTAPLEGQTQSVCTPALLCPIGKAYAGFHISLLLSEER